jgi:hypothetical protein
LEQRSFYCLSEASQKLLCGEANFRSNALLDILEGPQLLNFLFPYLLVAFKFINFSLLHLIFLFSFDEVWKIFYLKLNTVSIREN